MLLTSCVVIPWIKLITPPASKALEMVEGFFFHPPTCGGCEAQLPSGTGWGNGGCWFMGSGVYLA